MHIYLTMTGKAKKKKSIDKKTRIYPGHFQVKKITFVLQILVPPYPTYIILKTYV